MQWVKPELTSTVQFDVLPPTEAIAVLPPKYMPEQLLRHAQQLTSVNMQGRGLGTAGLNEASLYIADQFRNAGLQPLAGTFVQRWSESVAGKGLTEMFNVVGMIAGTNLELNSQPVILGAHFDHLGIDTIVITGTLSNICCEATARDAMMLGFKVVFVSDGNAALSDEEHLASMITIAQGFGDVRTTEETIAILQAGAAATKRAQEAAE